jgi:hypothetical protein
MVATTALDVGAHVLPTHLSLHGYTQNTISRLYNLRQSILNGVPYLRPREDGSMVDRSFGLRYQES